MIRIIDLRLLGVNSLPTPLLITDQLDIYEPSSLTIKSKHNIRLSRNAFNYAFRKLKIFFRTSVGSFCVNDKLPSKASNIDGFIVSAQLYYKYTLSNVVSFTFYFFEVIGNNLIVFKLMCPLFWMISKRPWQKAEIYEILRCIHEYCSLCIRDTYIWYLYDILYPGERNLMRIWDIYIIYDTFTRE